MSAQAVAHNRNQLRVDLVLVLLVVLPSHTHTLEWTKEASKAEWNGMASAMRTRLSLSNSTSMTACF
jgi:hypothetical protein